MQPYVFREILPPLITASEARKLLGKDADGLSDDQIYALIADLSLLAEQYLRHNGSKKRLGKRRLGESG